MFMLMFWSALLFFILMVYWKSISLGILDVVLWFILSVSVISIEIPYVAMTSGDAIVEGVQVIESSYVLSPLFAIIGIITLIYWLVEIIFPTLNGRVKMM